MPKAGGVVTTADEGLPFRVEDAAGIPIAVVDSYLLELMAAGRAVSTLRSYAMDLLRWFRFLWAVGVAWDRATRTDARDFSIWIRLTVKPTRNGRASSELYAPATVAHSETVVRLFYEHHRDGGDGPILNPFPTHSHRHGRANAHHNPMEPFRHERAGRYRPPGCRAAYPTRRSISCSPSCRVTATVPWWRSSCRPEREHRSWSGWMRAISILVSS